MLGERLDDPLEAGRCQKVVVVEFDEDLPTGCIARGGLQRADAAESSSPQDTNSLIRFGRPPVARSAIQQHNPFPAGHRLPSQALVASVEIARIVARSEHRNEHQAELWCETAPSLTSSTTPSSVSGKEGDGPRRGDGWRGLARGATRTAAPRCLRSAGPRAGRAG